MRRTLACLLAVIWMLSICGCAADTAEEITTPPIETEAATEAAVSTTKAGQTDVVESAVAEETEPALPGELLLSVSKIDFSVVGESEDIFVGTADRQQIVWTSADESVITVEDGVLTAVGVGSTTVSAQFGDQVAECTAGCLAATEEELNSLSEEILRAPKRYPTVLENPPLELYSDAAFVGDSITYIMFQNETRHGILGHPLFLVRSGTSLNGLVMRYKNVYYRGVEMNFEDAVAESGAKKIFIMLGQNDLSYMTIEDTMANYKTMVDRIREKSPDIQIHLQSCVPEWFKNGANNEKNEKIDEFNVQLEAY